MTDKDLVTIDDELLNIPGDVVGVDYIMNPQTDDLIPGDRLEEGMVVLAEMNMLRGNPESEFDTGSAWGRHRIQETARWCKVTSLEFIHGHDNTLAKFIGLYGDGVKMSRTYGTGHYWIVKKPAV